MRAERQAEAAPSLGSNAPWAPPRRPGARARPGPAPLGPASLESLYRLRTQLTQLALLTLLATLALAATPSTAAVAVEDGFTRHLADRINDYRRHHGLAPLVLSDELSGLAAEHSSAMATSRALSHQGFRDRRQRTDSRICVENVAHNFPTPETLLEGWRRSAAHHRNLLEPKVERMGLAAIGRYVTFFACH